jgi:hypothetical protein
MHRFVRGSTLRTFYGAPATLLACALAAGCGGVAPGEMGDFGENAQAATGTITISGQVTEPQGMPVDSVTVKLSGSKQATAVTDFAGNYTFTVPSGGSYSISASGVCSTWAPGVKNLNKVTANQVLDFLGSGGACVVAPQQGATSGSFTISGHVTSAGQPVAGSTVTLSGSAQGVRIADETGGYSFSVNSGSYTVSIAGACSSFSTNLVHLNGLTSSKVQNFTGTSCPPPPLTLCPALDSSFIGESGGAACSSITTLTCPDRTDTWDLATVNDFVIALSGDCRFGNFATSATTDQVIDYLNGLIAFTLELFGCPFQGLQTGPLTDKLVPAFLSTHKFTSADLQGFSDDYVAGFIQAFADFGLPAPTTAQVSALKAQLTYLQSKVPNQAPGSTFSLSTCSP